MSTPRAATTSSKTDKALEAALAGISKNFGSGAVMLMGDRPMGIERVSSGNLAIDIALGGGVPRGRLLEIYGPESSGKTTFCAHVIAEFQKLGGKAAFIDTEHSIDPVYMKAIGVDVDKLLISQPDHGEQALQITEQLMSSGALDVMVIDSIAALVPKAEIEGEIGDNFVGLQARMMSQALRKLSGLAAQTGTTLIFTNQLREKIGVMFGSPETTPGGKAMKFYASIRIDIRRTGSGKDSNQQAINNTVKLKIVKNKTAPPFRLANIIMSFGHGYDTYGTILEMAIADKIVTKSGSFLKYAPMDITAQGAEKFKTAMAENEKLFTDIRDAILEIRMPKAEEIEASIEPPVTDEMPESELAEDDES